MKYNVEREVTAARGWQTFQVEADSLEEAKEKFLNGEAVIVAEEIEVLSLSKWDFDEIYEEE
ncbi:MAG: DUF1381 domain-containing protein [Deltaproteobacteria bacterium]|jgi:hypothetical protein|nr:DUF1381 domain-containing protein [Deltaproteobacteria bacterium]